MKRVVRVILMALFLLPTSCMEWDYGYEEPFKVSDEGLFVVNEGNFQYGNATLSYYDPAQDSVYNEVLTESQDKIISFIW